MAGKPQRHWNSPKSTDIWITPAYMLPITVPPFRRSALKFIARDSRVFGKRIPVAVNNFCYHFGIAPVPVDHTDHSCIASSRLARSAGSAMATSSATAANRKAAEIGRMIKTIGSPNEIIIARRRFSSIIGPST